MLLSEKLDGLLVLGNIWPQIIDHVFLNKSTIRKTEVRPFFRQFHLISSNFITDIPFSKSSHSRIHEWCLEIIQITPQETCRLSGVINSSTTTTESCRRIFFGQKMSRRHLPFPSIKRTPCSSESSQITWGVNIVLFSPLRFLSPCLLLHDVNSYLL